jgi:hypothetical protein
MTVTLGDKLVLTKDVDPKELKSSIKKLFEESPVAPQGAIAYSDKLSKKKFKVSVTKSGDKVTITNVVAA